jgi:hypothetical protein
MQPSKSTPFLPASIFLRGVSLRELQSILEFMYQVTISFFKYFGAMLLHQLAIYSTTKSTILSTFHLMYRSINQGAMLFNFLRP